MVDMIGRSLVAGIILFWGGWISLAFAPEPVAEPKERLKPAAAEIKIEGHYQVTGVIKENNYEGLLTVTKNNGSYTFRWTLGGAYGFGVREGNTIGVGMQNRDKVITGMLYRIGKDENGNPKLFGRWAPGDGEIYEEVATWLKETR
jgi:hypothetical protein